MKKLRRITAMIGVIVLLGLYIAAFVLAIFGGDDTINLFWAAIVATIILPVLLWAYSFIYRLLKRNYSEEARAEEEKMRADYLKREKEEGEDFYKRMNNEDPEDENQ